MSALVPVILAGGVGTRLWPLSREYHPKQFLSLPDGKNLLYKAFQRAITLKDTSILLTVINQTHYFQTCDVYNSLNQASQLENHYLLEPEGRNTAPSIALATLIAQKVSGPETCLLILPADHIIENQLAFQENIIRAQKLAQHGMLITFGIRPTHPSTHLGYIEKSDNIIVDNQMLGHHVCRFVEKPHQESADSFLKAENYFWNSGIFCFQANIFLKHLEICAPDIYEGALRCLELTHQQDNRFEFPAIFKNLPDISVDYAVMEKSDKIAMIPAQFDWNDLGTWSTYAELYPPDSEGNRTQGETMLHRCRNTMIHSPERLTAAIGVENLVIVDTPDALLVATKDQTQAVKTIVERLKISGHETHAIHRTVCRPWGTYTVLEEGFHFKIKRLVVKPGAALSLQKHHHRSEHWIVISGIAKVLNGEVEHLLHTNESAYIPVGTLHRLSNPGMLDLTMIEVQSGEYLGEDDIVRVDDIYGRPIKPKLLTNN